MRGNRAVYLTVALLLAVAFLDIGLASGGRAPSLGKAGAPSTNLNASRRAWRRPPTTEGFRANASFPPLCRTIPCNSPTVRAGFCVVSEPRGEKREGEACPRNQREQVLEAGVVRVVAIKGPPVQPRGDSLFFFFFFFFFFCACCVCLSVDADRM